MPTNDAGETLIEFEALELEGTAHWRSEKAEQHPDDERNAEAASLCLNIAKRLRALESHSKQAAEFEALHDFIFTDATDEGDSIEVVRLWGEYRSRVGFDNFPLSAEEYLDDLLEIARDASPVAKYVSQGLQVSD
jgi:hypothetical protein